MREDRNFKASDVSGPSIPFYAGILSLHLHNIYRIRSKMNEEDRLSEAGTNTSQHGGSKAKPKKAKEPLKETAETAQNTALVDEVISMFKGDL